MKPFAVAPGTKGNPRQRFRQAGRGEGMTSKPGPTAIKRLWFGTTLAQAVGVVPFYFVLTEFDNLN